MRKETIAAISTGMTNSGIGIVRISGEEAVLVADRIYRGKKKLCEVKSHTINYGYIVDREISSAEKKSEEVDSFRQRGKSGFRFVRKRSR